MIRILIVDDQSFTRKAIQALLEKEGDFEIIGQAANGIEALKYIKRNRPDIALVDLEMPEMNGFSLTYQISQNFHQTKVIILSACDDKDSIDTAVKAGAKGFLLKNTSGQEIADTIRYVQRGYFQLGPGLFEKILAGMSGRDPLNSDYVSRLETKAQKSFDRLETELERRNQIIRRELFHELEIQINSLKQDFRHGLDNFQHRVGERMKQGFSSLSDRVNQNQNGGVDLRNWEQQINAREYERQQQVNRVLTGTRQSMQNLEKKVNFLRNCLLCLGIGFVAEQLALWLF